MTQNKWHKRLLVASTFAMIASSIAYQKAPAAKLDAPVTPGAPTKTELVVYNDDLALVKQERPITFSAGINNVRYTDVAAKIDSTSVLFRSITAPTTTRVLEQNFEYDLVSSDKLLEKYVDQSIEVVTQDGTAYSGVLLSGGSGDITLQSKDGKVVVLSRAQIRTFNFPSLPDGLITRPTLVWTVDTNKSGAHSVDVSYLTSGISWQANYNLLLSNDEKTLGLNGWVTLDNRTGASFKDAKLKLVAGNIARAEQPTAEAMYKIAANDYAAAAPTPQVSERGFFEYHLYEVNRPVTVSNNQTKQVEFVTGTGITTTKFFVFDGSGVTFGGYGPIFDQNYGVGAQAKVKTMLEFQTGKANNLDAPLPEGVVRVFKRDVDGSQLLIGEDRIKHTPKNEKVRLYVGDAFDIVGERTQTDFKRLGDKTVEETFKITLRNHKDSDATVRVVENLYRWSDWEIVQASNKNYTKQDAQTIEWRVPVKANGEAEITYTVRYSF